MGKKERQNRVLKGHVAESIALWWLRLKGYHHLATRYRTKHGEIDLLFRKKDTLIAVEVKARKTLETAVYSVLPKQQTRIKNTMLHYVRTHGLNGCSLRFDVVAIVPWRLPLHITDAWRPDY